MSSELGEEILEELLSAPVEEYRDLRAFWQSRERTEEYVLTLEPAAERWTVTNITSGVRSSYESGQVTTGGETVPSAGYRSVVTAPPLQLLFPEHLPLWGRRGRDSDAPISREPVGAGHELITFVSDRDPFLRKYLVVDKRRMLPVRFQDSLTVTIIDGPTR